MSQFTLPHNDILELSSRDFSEAALVAILLEIEMMHPGTLAYAVRMMALAADGWHFRATASNPERSIKVQKDLVSMLSELTSEINKHGN